MTERVSPKKEAARNVVDKLQALGRDGIQKKDIVAAIRALENAGWERGDLPDLFKAYLVFDKDRKAAASYIFDTSFLGNPIEKKVKGGGGEGVLKDLRKTLKEFVQQIVLQEKTRFEKETGKKQVDPKTNLLQYKDDPWVFVHMSEILKFGVYPNMKKLMKSGTPVGIFGSPLGKYFPDIMSDSWWPFSSRRYMFVFRLKPEAQSKALIIGSSGEILKSPITEDDMSYYFDKTNYDGGFDGRSLFRISKEYVKGNPLSWRNFLHKELGISAIIDEGSGAIFSEEPYQAAFFSVQDLEILDMIDQGEESDWVEKLPGGVTKRMNKGGRIEHYNAQNQLHRLDGPALYYNNNKDKGYQAWYQNDKLHRKDGPAIITKTGEQQWFYKGIFYGIGIEKPANFPV